MAFFGATLAVVSGFPSLCATALAALAVACAGTLTACTSPPQNPHSIDLPTNTRTPEPGVSEAEARDVDFLAGMCNFNLSIARNSAARDLMGRSENFGSLLVEPRLFRDIMGARVPNFTRAVTVEMRTVVTDVPRFFADVPKNLTDNKIAAVTRGFKNQDHIRCLALAQQERARQVQGSTPIANESSAPAPRKGPCVASFTAVLSGVSGEAITPTMP